MGYRPPSRFVLIIGAMKSGTTSLFDLLGQHPEICACRTKEPDFFTAPGAGPDLSTYLGLWDWDAGRHSVALEASVSYTKLPFFPGVAERIQDANLGDVRFIYVMRHPLTRIESQLRHSLYAGWGNPLDERLDPDLLAYSRYATQLDEYRRHFGRERLLPLFLDDLEQRPESVLQQVCGFLEIDPGFSFHDLRTRRNTGDFYEAWPRLALVGKSSWGRTLLRHVIPIGLKSRLRTLLARTQPRLTPDATLGGRWRLNDAERETLWAALDDELTRLESDYRLTLPASWRR